MLYVCPFVVVCSTVHLLVKWEEFLGRIWILVNWNSYCTPTCSVTVLVLRDSVFCCGGRRNNKQV